jgi:hypothetical protein
MGKKWYFYYTIAYLNLKSGRANMARLFERDIYFFNFKIFNIFYLHFLIPFIYSWYYNYFIIDVIEGEVNLKFCRLREQIVDTLIKHYQKRISSN